MTRLANVFEVPALLDITSGQILSRVEFCVYKHHISDYSSDFLEYFIFWRLKELTSGQPLIRCSCGDEERIS
jgi:hypothetical protein